MERTSFWEIAFLMPLKWNRLNNYTLEMKEIWLENLDFWHSSFGRHVRASLLMLCSSCFILTEGKGKTSHFDTNVNRHAFFAFPALPHFHWVTSSHLIPPTYFPLSNPPHRSWHHCISPFLCLPSKSTTSDSTPARGHLRCCWRHGHRSPAYKFRGRELSSRGWSVSPTFPTPACLSISRRWVLCCTLCQI